MTTTQELATIDKVDPREIWPSEPQHFTPWLAKHISELGKALGLEDIELRSVEAPVGGYKLDILAHDVGRDRPVAIENQLEATDHTHLGQLLTYAAGYEANVLIWIAREFNEEHREALDLLNRRTDEETEFFGVIVEVWKIDDSRPAPHFKVVSAPNDWRKGNLGSRRAGIPSEREERYRAFFQPLLDTLREEHRFTVTNAQVRSTRHWRTFSSGTSGLTYNPSFASGGRARMELYIDCGEREWNKKAFDHLEGMKDSLESELRESLNWQRLDSRRACRISAERQGSIDDEEDALEGLRDWMIERLIAFKKVFGPRLNELQRELK